MSQVAQITTSSGSVSSVSVATANGFKGSATAGATPVITVQTTVNGVMKGDGTTASVATVGTDYSVGTSALATGILKSTTATGALSIAVANTDYQVGDATLTALAAYNTNGFLVQTAADTFAGRTLTNGIGIGTITNPAGTAGNPVIPASANSIIRPLGVVIDGGGTTIATGLVKTSTYVPYACTITGWTLLGDQSGSIVVDVWLDTYANYPPTVADTITGADKPTITTALKGQNLAVTLWTVAVPAGSTIRYNVDSVTSLTNVNLTIQATLSS